MRLSILDQDGRVYNDQDEATASFVFYDDQDINTQSAIINREAIASGGVFEFAALNVLITPDSTAFISLIVEGIESYGNEIGFLDDAPTLEFEARACIEGESYGNNLSCLPCPAGYFLYIA